MAVYEDKCFFVVRVLGNDVVGPRSAPESFLKICHILTTAYSCTRARGYVMAFHMESAGFVHVYLASTYPFAVFYPREMVVHE